MKGNIVFNLLQIIFTLVGAGLIIAGYFASEGALTKEGYPLNYFFYILGSFFIIWPAILFGAIRFFQRRAAARIAYLKASGIKGKARVREMRRTGVLINKVPQMLLDLKITTELGEQFDAVYRKCISPVYYSLIRPDLDLPVYVDPVNRKKLYVDFQEAWAAMAGGNRNSNY